MPRRDSRTRRAPRPSPRGALLACLAAGALACRSAAPGAEGAPSASRGGAPTYELFAVRYGTLPTFPLRSLIEGADPGRQMDIALMVWLLRGSNGRTVLVDAGFHRDKFVQRWKPTDYVRPSEAVARAGVRAEDVTDVVITHIHWDHADGADLFPNARIWIQREEYDHHVGPNGEVLDRAADPDVAAMFARLRRAGRVSLVDGDGQEPIPGITVYTGGKHTFGSQYVGARTPSGVAVVASDNLYLYENLALRKPIAQTLDRESNLRAQERMLRIASDRRLVVPGHDPAVFERFPSPGNGVAKIE